MKPLVAYLSASRNELSKVAWPDRQQTIRLTFLVIGFSLVLAAILGGVDYLFAAILQKVILKG